MTDECTYFRTMITFCLLSSFHKIRIMSKYIITGVTTPHHNDVLCGRGSSSRDHPGNGQFRSFVKTLKEECIASVKSEKPRFAKVIVIKIRSLSPPGRFLKLGVAAKGQDTSLWYEIGDKEAIRKTRQALREEAKQIRECLKNNGKVIVSAQCLTILLFETWPC